MSGHSIVAVEHGANRVDASLTGMGAGASNAPLEVFIAAATKLGRDHGCDMHVLQDAADDIVRPRRIDQCAWTAKLSRWVMQASTQPSCVTPKLAPHATTSTPARSSRRPARRGMVGSQEDMLVDITLDLTAEREVVCDISAAKSGA
jgi:4-hydroxy 2-oxovalerate aldolase